MIVVRNMTSGLNEANDDGRKAYSVNIQVKAPSSASCAFCWFVLTTYPDLKGMNERDGSTFRAHLQQEHGLKGEIQP